MNILYLLIGASLLAALVFLVLFIWSVRTGQYDDNYGSSVRVLFDDETPADQTDKTDKTESTNNNKISK